MLTQESGFCVFTPGRRCDLSKRHEFPEKQNFIANLAKDRNNMDLLPESPCYSASAALDVVISFPRGN